MLKKLTPTLVPGIPPIPKDASPELRAYLTALGEALQVRLGRRGDPRDRAVTLRELVDSGLAKELKTQQFDPNNYVASNLGFATNTAPNLAVPPAPAGLSGSAAFQTVILTWNSSKDPSFLYSNHSLTEIYRHTSDVIGDAVFAGSTPAAIFADDTVSSGTTYYYWVRYVSTDSIKGPFNATNGVAVAATDVNAITSANLADLSVLESKLADAAVAVAKLADDAVTTAKIADNAVQADQLADAAVAVAKLADDAVTTAKIADNAIQADQISANAVVAAKIQAGAVVAAKIAAGAIVADKIAADAVVADKIAADAVVAAKIQAGAIVAGKIATNAIVTNNIQAGQIDADRIAANAITTAKIAADQVTTAKIAAGTITADSAILANAAVVEANIADAAISRAKIVDAAIDSAQIEAAAITTAKIGTAAITEAKIGSAAITSAKIGTAAVGTLTIAGNAVTVPAGTTQGSDVYSSSTIISSFTTTSSISFTVPQTMTIILSYFVIPLINGDGLSHDSGRQFQVRLRRDSTVIKSYNFAVINNSDDDVSPPVAPSGLPFVSTVFLDTNVSAATYTYTAQVTGTRGYRGATLSLVGAMR
tara:strand:+ start:422 stop:2203 length:1782 start_codon:yes stop_codon:yes gene_type:complete